MNYKKISLNAHGAKGAEIFFLEPNDKGLQELTKKYPRNPCHIGMQKLFKDLRPHLLNICGIINSDMDMNIMAQYLLETTVDCIELDGGTITLSGEKLATADKYIKLKTYKLEAEDGYEQYDEVFNLVNAICEETTEYLKGNKKADDIEAAMQWLEMKGSVKVKEDGKTKTLTIDDIKEFSPEKLKEWATKLLETNFGSVILHNEDLDHDGVDVTAAVQELKTEFEITEEVSQIEVAESKPKKDKKVKETAPSTNEEEQF
ncbi:MAG: hypothetical protein WC055_02050 [Melioribacteraceae bacterium]